MDWSSDIKRALNRKKILFCVNGCIGLLVFFGGWANQLLYAQDSAERDSLDALYGSGLGFEVVVTNSGFGLGGYYSQSLDPSNSFIAEFSIGSEKSEREVKFIGIPNYIPDKANYFLRVPIRMGLQRRLWKEYIEDNFRPYMQFAFGPTLGWQYPYFDDDNGNGTFDEDDERRYDGLGSIFKGDFRFGIGGTIGIGAYFGENTRLSQGVRIAYSFNYFFRPIQLLENEEQISPPRYFGTPAISITFGKIF